LLNTDLNKLNYYLSSQFSEIKTAAIDSVPATVTNLGVDMEKMKRALIASFEKKYSEGAEQELKTASVLTAEIEKYEKKQRSKLWRFGATPAFSIVIKNHCLKVVKGVVVDVSGDEESEYKNKPFWECCFF